MAITPYSQRLKKWKKKSYRKTKKVVGRKMKEEKKLYKPVASGCRVLHELTTCLSISSIETSCKTGHPFCRSRNFYTIAHELSSDDLCLFMCCKCITIRLGRFCWLFCNLHRHGHGARPCISMRSPTPPTVHQMCKLVNILWQLFHCQVQSDIGRASNSRSRSYLSSLTSKATEIHK